MRTVLLLSILGQTLIAQEQGKISLYFLQLPVGQETYELRDGILHASFEYTERNSKVPLTATLSMKPDLTPLEFEIHGKSYRPFSVDAHFVNDGRTAPERFFTVDGYATGTRTGVRLSSPRSRPGGRMRMSRSRSPGRTRSTWAARRSR
jgi:hypothetical protein